MSRHQAIWLWIAATSVALAILAASGRLGRAGEPAASPAASIRLLRSSPTLATASSGGGTATAGASSTAPAAPSVSGASGPSLVIFPAQSIPLRFDHAQHARLGLGCVDCHPAALTSTAATDRVLPAPQTCDACHGTVHRDIGVTTAGPRSDGSCSTCHVGWNPLAPAAVARVVLGESQAKFNHRVHAARNIRCGQCHGEVQKVALATRDTMPTMQGCLGCHNLPAQSRGDARAECWTCHLTDPGGHIRTRLPTGVLLPPRWLGNAEHGADFAHRHGHAAADNSRFCASCHADDECAHCHDNRVRPRDIHPNDFISMHPIAARQNSPRCSSCHHEQSFCLSCHQRSGVTMSGPPANRQEQGRFHPPTEVFTTGPRSSRHHGSEAQRNLSACVSCHTERDCASCHASTNGGGLGVNPHPGGFVARCATAFHRNPRPCLVCHQPDEPVLGSCR